MTWNILSKNIKNKTKPKSLEDEEFRRSPPFHLAGTASVTSDGAGTQTVVGSSSTCPPAVQLTTDSVQIFTYEEAVPVAFVVAVGSAIFIFLYMQERRRRNNGRNRWRIFFCNEAVPLLEEEVRDVEIELEDPVRTYRSEGRGAVREMDLRMRMK